MNYRDVKFPDSVNGLGVMVSIFVCGCHFHCKNCQNSDIWDQNAGQVFDDSVIEKILNITEKRRPYMEGLSLLGGEPLEEYNQEGLAKLAKMYKERFPEKKVWCWTGFDFEKDVFGKMYKDSETTKKLLENIDYIIDGNFIEDKKIINLVQRGSYNQRKFDVKESIKSGSPVLIKFGDENRFEELEMNRQTKNESISINKIHNSIFVEMPVEIEKGDQTDYGQISFSEVSLRFAADSIDIIESEVNKVIVDTVDNNRQIPNVNVDNIKLVNK